MTLVLRRHQQESNTHSGLEDLMRAFPQLKACGNVHLLGLSVHRFNMECVDKIDSFLLLQLCTVNEDMVEVG